MRKRARKVCKVVTDERRAELRKLRAGVTRLDSHWHDYLERWPSKVFGHITPGSTLLPRIAAESATIAEDEKREQRVTANRLDRDERMTKGDPEQQALDALVAKRLGIRVEDVPAWRAARRGEIAAVAGLGSLADQTARAPSVNPMTDD